MRSINAIIYGNLGTKLEKIRKCDNVLNILLIIWQSWGSNKMPFLLCLLFNYPKGSSWNFMGSCIEVAELLWLV